MNDVEEAYMRFAKAVLARITAWQADGKINHYKEPGVAFGENGFRVVEKTLPNYSLVLGTFYCKNELYDPIPEADECARIHLDKGLIPKPELSSADGKPIAAPTFEQLKSYLISELSFPLMEVLETAGISGATDSWILDTYRRYLEHWAGLLPSYELLFPLHGIECSCVDLPIKIDNELRLQKFSTEEQGKYWRLQLLSLFDFSAFEKSNLALAALPNNLNTDRKEIEKKVRLFITALRLTDAGDVGAPMIMHRPLRRAMWGGGAGKMPETSARVHGVIFKLDQNDKLGKAIALYNQLLTLEQNNRLRQLETAIRRFNQSYSRDLFEDRIIDLTIVLEATLLHGIDDELKYRLAMHGAKLMSETDVPEETFSFLKALYDLRSKIVHEGYGAAQIANEKQSSAVKKVFDQIGGFNGANKTESYVRSVLVLLIQKLASSPGLSLKCIVENLDIEILGAIGKSTKDK